MMTQSTRCPLFGGVFFLLNKFILQHVKSPVRNLSRSNIFRCSHIPPIALSFLCSRSSITPAVIVFVIAVRIRVILRLSDDFVHQPSHEFGPFSGRTLFRRTDSFRLRILFRTSTSNVPSSLVQSLDQSFHMGQSWCSCSGRWLLRRRSLRPAFLRLRNETSP